MPVKTSSKISIFISWKKLLFSKVNLFLITGFFIFILIVWIRDSYEVSIWFFLYFFPHLFLFLSQGMVRDEIDKGSLENVLFLGGGFRKYLLEKNLALISFCSAPIVVFFLAFLVYGLVSEAFLPAYFHRFLIALLVGIYYALLGILLSYFFRSGANVVIVIIGQALVFLWILFAGMRASGLIDILDTGKFTDIASRIKFMGMLIVYPNFVISEKFIIFSLEIAFLILVCFVFQFLVNRKVELLRK
ncbi:MAG: hypothetical protein ACE5LC_09330 [Candidatus Aminicenantales bacterium]